MIAAKMKKEYTDYVSTFLIGKRIKHITTPVSITFEWYEANQRRDPDNIIFAKKFVLDGMVDAKVIVKDSQKYIIGVDESWYVRPNKIGLQVTIEEYEDE